MRTFFFPVSLILFVLLWAGMVLGISFLEAPVKFTAPSLSLAVGLDVGRHVFGVFNKVEMILALLVLASLIMQKNAIGFLLVCAVPLLLLILQSFWFWPMLDTRALTIISGGVPQGSSPHLWYVLFELVKVIFLLTAGLMGIYNLIAQAAKQ